MSDTTSRGDDDVLGGGFDQTNDQVSGLEGESDGTEAGENRSSEEQEDGTIAGGGVLRDLVDGRTGPNADDSDRMGSTSANEAGAADSDGYRTGD
jgi:hypothetical protein